MAYDQKTRTADEERGKREIKMAKKAFANSERVNAEGLWRKLAELILPNQNGGFFGDSTKAKGPSPNVFKSEPVIFNRDLANAVHSTLTNPAMEWSKLAFKTDSLNSDPEGIAWRQNATKEIHHMLSDSNFDIVMGECYKVLFALGTCVIFHEEVNKDGSFLGSNFQSWHLSEIAILENHMGDIDTIYRKFTMTSKQLVDKFGNTAVGESVVSVYENSPDKEYTVYICIRPRADKDISLNAIGLAAPNKRPYACFYLLEQGSRVLMEDGFYEFPVYVDRCSTLPGEVYGYGPGHDCLADILCLNAIQRDDLIALAKASNCPFLVQQGNLIGADVRPGHMTEVLDITQIKEFVTQARFDVTDNRMEKLISNIKSAFYIDKLMLPPRTETGEMTAYEIAQRLEQMQTVLGPLLSRLNSDILTPLVVRCLKMLSRAGKIPPMPQSILTKLDPTGLKKPKEIDFQVSFVNSLARSQQLAELRNVQTWLQETMVLAQMKPEVLDSLNADAVVAYSAKIRDIQGEFLLDPKSVQAIRDQRQKQIQAQQMLGAGQAVSEIAKNVGGAQNGQAK